MACDSKKVTVGTTATVLNHSWCDSIMVKNPSGGVTIYVGGPDVDTTDGFPVAAGETFSRDMKSRESVYAVVAASTHDVNVLIGGA